MCRCLTGVVGRHPQGCCLSPSSSVSCPLSLHLQELTSFFLTQQHVRLPPFATWQVLTHQKLTVTILGAGHLLSALSPNSPVCSLLCMVNRRLGDDPTATHSLFCFHMSLPSAEVRVKLALVICTSAGNHKGREEVSISVQPHWTYGFGSTKA